ncbi:MAG: PD-(D/E)XK nuclease family transposase, partial [Bacteroidaceae bacterium]|nr:PD-(D/E)XK nuclease family transposase [Bacteroidaceae bacterium]
TMYDKWLFALKNLTRLLKRPAALQERIFKRLFDEAEIASYSPDERREYEESVKEYRDYINTIDTAHEKGWKEGHKEGMAEGMEKGLAEGRAEGRGERNMEIAREMKSDGVAIEVIARYTGLTPEELRSL